MSLAKPSGGRVVVQRCTTQDSRPVPAVVDRVDSTLPPSFTSARTIGLQVENGIVLEKETDHA